MQGAAVMCRLKSGSSRAGMRNKVNEGRIRECLKSTVERKEKREISLVCSCLIEEIDRRVEEMERLQLTFGL